MTQEDGSNRKSSENKSNGQNIVLYLVAVAAGAALLVMWVVKTNNPVITYQDFLQLVDVNQPGVQSDGSIVVQTEHAGKPVRVRYTNLRNVSIGDRTIHGTVDLEYLTPVRGDTKRSGVKFVTYKSNSDAVEA